MYALHRLIALVLVLSIVASVSVLDRTAYAATATSSTYMTTNAVTTDFGGAATSSNFSSVLTGAEPATGESTSTHFLVDSGSLYYDTFTPESARWRWYDDETNETPTSSLAPENVSPSSVNNLNTVKLRLTLREIANIGADGVKFALQYSTSSDFSSGVHTVVESGACTPVSTWCYATCAGADNSVITTGLLSDSDPCVASVGNGCGTHNTSGTSTSTFTHVKNAQTEYEFTILESGAVSNTVYFFRPFNKISGTPVPLYATSTYPSLSTQGATLTFMIGGIATSTPTGGVTTDITTTSTIVPFGLLSVNTPVAGAQRLTVSTNAALGYEIYAFQQQGLTADSAAQLQPIGGTNHNPVSWNTGCAASSTSCYGYHTSENVLSGGSARFSADDTYAPFSSEPDEIAYSSGPA